MKSATRRAQFLAGHWLARCLASEYFGGAPAQWRWRQPEDGAPQLDWAGEGTRPTLQASLSHSGAWIAAAVAEFPIGVDVEQPGKPRDLLALAAHVFSPPELAQLEADPESLRSRLFYRLWTLKEANGKRDGRGLRPALARHQHPVESEPAKAEAISWEFSEVQVSLVGRVGMSVLVTGLPESASPRYWRISTLPD